MRPRREPWNYAWKIEHRLLGDMVHGVYRVGVSSTENDRSPYVFLGPQSGGSDTC